jgi:DNA-binding NarL/FixJ family response regulator
MNQNLCEFGTLPGRTLPHSLSVSPEAGNQCHKARVLVVEDHPFLRQGIVRLINLQSDLVCCGEAGSLAAVVDAVIKEKPDLLLMDLHLPDGDGFQLIDFLRPQFPDLMILVLSQSGEVSFARRALSVGANGYVIKQNASEMLNAIRELLRGKVYVSRELVEQLMPTMQLYPLRGVQQT